MTGEHHVLIIEDDSRAAELHSSMLRRDGYEADVARDTVSRIDVASALQVRQFLRESQRHEL